MNQQITTLVNDIINHKIDLNQLDQLDTSTQQNLANQLLSLQDVHRTSLANIVLCVGRFIPNFAKDMRLDFLKNLIRFSYNDEAYLSTNAFRFLTPKLINSLSHDQRLTLANCLKKNLKDMTNLNRGINIWGIVKILPFVHALYQKEIVQDLFLLGHDDWLKKDILENLVQWIYATPKEKRMDYILFFTENLFNSEFDNSHKMLVFDFLKLACATISSENCTIILDNLLPLLQNQDATIVKKCMEFMHITIGLVPQSQRFQYIEMLTPFLSVKEYKNLVGPALKELCLVLSDETQKHAIRQHLKEKMA